MQIDLKEPCFKSGAELQSFEKILNQVMAYQNVDVVARLQRELNLSEEEANLLFDDTKLFLYLTATHPGTWVPPSKVDDGWHEFLMFTRDYAQFCQSCFGRFIHHEPKRLNETLNFGVQRRKTVVAARELFGELSSNWSAEIEGTCCGGGNDGCSPYQEMSADACSGDGSDGTGNSDGCNGCR